MLTDVTGSLTIGTNNIFDKLDYGVHGTNSNVTIQRNTFRNLRGMNPAGCAGCPIPTPPLPPVGVGVFVTALPNPARPAFSVTVGGSAVQANTFNECYQAVNAFDYATVSIQRNSIINNTVNPNFPPTSINLVGNTGIIIRNTKGYYFIATTFTPLTVNVLNNTISNYRLGVSYTLDDQSILANTVFNVNNNSITAPLLSAYTGIRIQSIIPGPSAAANNTWLVQNNNIVLATTGVHMVNTINPPLRVLTNTVSIKNGICYGVRAENSNATVGSNSISGPGNTSLNIRGISIELSSITTNNNTIRDFGVGIHCFGVSRSQLTCNKMHNCQRGVFLNNSDIGDQKPGGGVPSDNQWFNSTGNDMLRSGGVSNTWDIRNAATYNPSLNLPTDIAKVLLPSTAANNCPATVPVVCGPVCQQQLMGQIAANQIPFQSFVPQSQFLSEQFVFNQLANDASLMNQGTAEDAVLQNFYNSNQLSAIGQLHDVNELISSGNIAQAASINSSIAAASDIAQNHQIFNNTYLNTLALGNNQFTAQQINQLTSIAQQCPLTGGTAVYQARVLLSIINDSIVDYDDNCVEEEGGGARSMETEDPLLPVKQVISNPAFKLYPNPNNGTMTLDYILEKEQKGIFVIYDLLGKKQAEYELQQNVNSISINEAMLNNGIYFYKVLVNNKLVVTDKLVIVK